MMKICFKKTQWLVVVFLILIGGAGCGSSGSSDTTDTTGTVEEGAYAMAITLENLSSGETASINNPFTLGIGEEARLTATVTGPDGAAAAGRLVTATFADGTCRFLDTTDGSMSTDADGQVSMRFTLISGVTETGETLTVTSDVPAESTSTAPTATMNFTIDPFNQAGTIEFVSATPTLIGLTGTTDSSDLPSQSILEFVVKDNQTNPAYGQTVNFSLTTDMGGITLEPATAVTDIEGKVSVVLHAGNAPTAVRVRADVADTSLYTLSSELILSTGFPDQNSFSLSAEILNPEAMAYDGEIVAVTVRAGDINNNPVPDGTAIYFTTEAGVIESGCLTENGACSVEWRSQAPRTFGTDNKVTILAHAQGEESFQDLNGTGRYEVESDKLLTDLAEAFLDENGNGSRDLDEKFVDFNNDQLYTAANGIYNGTLCESGPTGCSTDLVHVRDDIRIVMAESFADISFDTTGVTFNTAADIATITITVKGINLGTAMPNGTTIAVTAPDNAEINGKSDFTVENATDPGTFTITLTPVDSAATNGTTDILLVEVTTPKGNYSTASLIVTNNLP